MQKIMTEEFIAELVKVQLEAVDWNKFTQNYTF
jgi:hypothetical protein